MTVIRRLDHVAIAVRDTEAALALFGAGYGLDVLSSEEIEQPHVRLTYLDCGNVTIQLVEPLDEGIPIADFIAQQGEGLHHICFAVDDVPAGAGALSPEQSPPLAIGSGRLRSSPGTRPAAFWWR